MGHCTIDYVWAPDLYTNSDNAEDFFTAYANLKMGDPYAIGPWPSTRKKTGTLKAGSVINPPQIQQFSIKGDVQYPFIRGYAIDDTKGGRVIWKILYFTTEEHLDTNAPDKADVFGGFGAVGTATWKAIKGKKSASSGAQTLPFTPSPFLAGEAAADGMSMTPILLGLAAAAAVWYFYMRKK